MRFIALPHWLLAYLHTDKQNYWINSTFFLSFFLQAGGHGAVLSLLLLCRSKERNQEIILEEEKEEDILPQHTPKQ